MERKDDHPLGYWLMLASALSGGFVANCYKELTFSLTPEMLTFLSRLFPLIPFVFILFYREGRHFKTSQFPLLILVALFYFLAMYGYIIALKSIPIVLGSLLINCGPIWTPFIARIWLKEKIHYYVWIGILISFVGVVLVLQPGFGEFHAMAIVALLSGVSMALAFVSNRKLSEKDSSQTIVFYTMIFMALFSLIPVLIRGFLWPYTKEQSLWPIGVLIVAGILTYVYQYLRAKAVSLVKAAKVMPFSFAGPVFAGLFSWIFFGSIPNPLFVLGALLVIGGITVIIKAK